VRLWRLQGLRRVREHPPTPGRVLAVAKYAFMSHACDARVRRICSGAGTPLRVVRRPQTPQRLAPPSPKELAM